jgi:short-subunit dehydrogenase
MFGLNQPVYSWKDKRVWLTGASSGIGLSLAKKLLDAGACVAVSARNENKLAQHFANIPNSLICPLDVSVKEENFKAVEKIVSHFSGIDCTIFNAGNAEYIDVAKFASAPFENMIRTNFLSMVYGIEASLPWLRRSAYPYLVGMSSSVAWQGLPRGEAYSASKAAIANMLQGLRIELARENIKVTTIFPGFVQTPLTDKNDFAMPFRISAEAAADILIRDLARQRSSIHFPKRFTCLLKLISLLPDALNTRILKQTVPER